MHEPGSSVIASLKLQGWVSQALCVGDGERELCGVWWWCWAPAVVPPSSMGFAMSSDSTLPSCFCLPILALDGLPGCNSLMLLENLSPEKAFQFSAPLSVGGCILLTFIMQMLHHLQSALLQGHCFFHFQDCAALDKWPNSPTLQCPPSEHLLYSINMESSKHCSAITVWGFL